MCLAVAIGVLDEKKIKKKKVDCNFLPTKSTKVSLSLRVAIREEEDERKNHDKAKSQQQTKQNKRAVQ